MTNKFLINDYNLNTMFDYFLNSRGFTKQQAINPIIKMCLEHKKQLPQTIINYAIKHKLDITSTPPVLAIY